MEPRYVGALFYGWGTAVQGGHPSWSVDISRCDLQAHDTLPSSYGNTMLLLLLVGLVCMLETLPKSYRGGSTSLS